MPSHQEVAERWVSVALGTGGPGKRNFTGKRLNIYGEHDTLYSYGFHFVLARLLRNQDGTPRLFLLNGDRSTVTTTKHQAATRSAVSWIGRTHGVPFVIIPFGVLDEAEIGYSSIELIERTEDRMRTEIVRHWNELPPGAKWHDRMEVDVPSGYFDKTTGERVSGWYDERYREMDWAERHGRIEFRDAVMKPTGERYVASVLHRWQEWNVTEYPDGNVEYWRERNVHMLGESLIKAKVEPRAIWGRDAEGFSVPIQQKPRVRYFLSGWDVQESRPAYFFCELPRSARPRSIEEAYEALKPDAVKVAESYGREVKRQGDVFAIPTRRSTADLKRMGGTVIERGAYILGTNHTATEVMRVGKDTYVRGVLWHKPERRRPDHKRVVIGKSWSLAMKNTVPVVKNSRVTSR